jgi:NAD(P)-dependent dehydrogenase (short-subunit alcohol dehydrogenase family)
VSRAAIITGGAGALGSAAVDAFLAAGWKVATLDHATGASRKDVIAVGGVDLADAKAASAAIEEAAGALGRVDALVNIAGGFTMATVAEADEAAFQTMFARNFNSALNASKAVLPKLGKGARIINVGAVGALKAGAGMSAYAASKSAVMRLTEAMAEEVKARGITVNAVLPVTIDTAQNRKDMPKADFKSWTPPSAIADVIVFLASPQSRAINGALIPVGNGDYEWRSESGRPEPR